MSKASTKHRCEGRAVYTEQAAYITPHTEGACRTWSGLRLDALCGFDQQHNEYLVQLQIWLRRGPVALRPAAVWRPAQPPFPI